MAAKKEVTSKGNGIKKSTIQTQSEMKTTEIRDLIDFIAQSGLNEVDIETKELKLHVKREPDQRVMKSSAAVVTAPVAITAPP
jgi:acetyl-CoA carboxylase biotin carboxyl carrier protein